MKVFHIKLHSLLT